MPNSLINPDVPITKQDLANFYQRILPYLGVTGELNDLSDVLITSASSGEVIRFNSTTEKWENAEIINDISSSSATTWSASKVSTELATKQETLTAGAGITITNNVISSSAAGVKLEIVETLPVSDIDPQTIYLVPSEDPQTDNEYDEYIYVENEWEIIGSTAIDLTNYYTKTQIDSMISSEDSQIASLSTSMSEIASVATSLSLENSTQNTTLSSLTSENSLQTSEITSLSTAESELSSEVEVLGSEVAEKQDILTAGDNITINNNVISATGGSANLYWEEIFSNT